jgi:Response regulator of the LytR/AlgR family
MIQCLICDDEPSVTDALSTLIEEYIHLNQTQICCQVYNNPGIAADAIKHEHFHLYLLDIVMPDMTGIALAEAIRKMDSNGLIVFLTSSPEYHAEAFALEALQYLEKPVNKSAFFRVLDRSLAYINQQRCSTPVTVQTRTGIHILATEKIIFVESNRHVLTFYLEDGLPMESLSGSLSLEKLSGILTSSHFYAPYKGYIINFDHVNSLGRNGFTMSNQTTIPISTRHYTKIRKDYSDYLLRTSETGGNE